MRYTALACDYDGTLAHHGAVDRSTIAALERLRQSGRRIIMVTGRELPDLLNVFSRADLFDRLVVENGGVVYNPVDRTQHVLADPPPQVLVDTLRHRGVRPLSVGHVIVATWQPQDVAVLETIRELGLELQVIFNKGAVMILPSGINKAAGLLNALESLQLSPHNVVGIGDAENDHAFLSVCECAVATANAVPALKARADWVTVGDHGAGVIELVEDLISSDLGRLDAARARDAVVAGVTTAGEEVRLKTSPQKLLIAGPSGSGKSSIATAFLEEVAERKYQFCVVDPEGDYQHFPAAVCLGDTQHEPVLQEILDLLAKPAQSLVINLLAVPLQQRPSFFSSLLPHLLELRVRTGRPHWIVADEAHHLLPTDWQPAPAMLPHELRGLLLITVHPREISPSALVDLDVAVITGPDPFTVLDELRHEGHIQISEVHPLPAPPGGALWWSRTTGRAVAFRPQPPHSERMRHQRKYASGELGVDKSFFFTGPNGALKLRAQNLILFVQLAEGVDDETWLYHLRRGDYSQWFREAIKDEELAEETAQLEQQAEIGADESRQRIRAVIEQRYTLPATNAPPSQI